MSNELPPPALYTHELLTDGEPNGVHVGCAERAICEQSYVEGETSRTIHEWFSAEQVRAAVQAERERCYSLVLESPYRARKGASWKSIAFDVLIRIRDGERPHIPPAAPQASEPQSEQGAPNE